MDSPQEAEPQRKTHWYQISLATLMLLVLFVGLALAFWQSQVRQRDRERTEAELLQVESALKKFRFENGIYPVSGADPKLLHIAVRRVWPRYQGDIRDDLLALGLDINNMDDSEALVFWLAGLPSGGKNPVPTGFSLNPSAPFGPISQRPYSTFPHFQFDPLRLTDADGDGWLEYQSPVSSQVVFELDSDTVALTRRESNRANKEP